MKKGCLCSYDVSYCYSNDSGENIGVFKDICSTCTDKKLERSIRDVPVILFVRLVAQVDCTTPR